MRKTNVAKKLKEPKQAENPGIVPAAAVSIYDMPSIDPAFGRALAIYASAMDSDPDFDTGAFLKFGQARAAHIQADLREVQLLRARRELVPVGMLIDIQRDTISMLRDTVGAALKARLSEWGVPPERVDELHDQLYTGLAGIYAMRTKDA